MKKLLALVMALCMLLSAIPALADVAEVVAEGETLTHDELVEKALAEEGTFIVYGNTTSRTLKSTPSSKAKSAVPPRAPTWS